MQRRRLIHAALAGSAAFALPAIGRAQAVEKPKLTIAVGGKNLLYYLPLTIAEVRGYLKDEGLDVTIADFAGGSRALQALVGGSADVVSGAFEHTINMQVKGQRLRAFVLQGRAPQIVLGINPKTMPNFKSVADLKGKKLGVTAPGSSTNVLANFVLGKVGLKPGDVSIIGVGAEADRVFGGPMPAACLYTQQSFLDKNPQTAQALANAIVRADKWIQGAGPAEIVKAVPESYLLGDRAVYIDAFLAAKGALSPDGMFPEAGAETARRALASIDPEIANAKIDLAAIYTNDYVKRANAKYPKG